jgi:predicted nucleotide-binding protein
LSDRYEPYHEQSLQMQSRPNVFIELGVALSLRRKRTIIIEFGELRPVADLAGLNVIRFNGENAVEALPKIIARLKRAGCLPAETQLGSWAETFNKLRVYTRRPNVESS